MTAFNVKVRAPGLSLDYRDTGVDSIAVHAAAIDKYGVCAVFITLA